MATIEFFAHPGHRLAEHHENTEYTCGACKTTGDGARYRCTDRSCSYDLHTYCATCPAELSSFMHPKHRLVFGVHYDKVPCDVCAESVDEYFYRCKDCNFNVHPICTQLPEEVDHVVHSKHPLTLQKASPGACIACAEECPSWRYRCGLGGACIIDIHIDCVLNPYSSPDTQSANQNHPPPQTRDIAYQKPAPPQFPPQPPLHGGYGYDNKHALPPQPQPPHHYYNNNPPPHPYNNHGYQNPSAPHFPPQQPNPSGYFYDHKANAPLPQPQIHHGYYQNPPYPLPYYGYHGHNQPHYYDPQPPPYNHAHQFAKPQPQNGFLGQTPQPPPCFEAGFAYGVPSGPSGHKVDSNVKPSKEEMKPSKEDGPKKGKKCKMMCAIVGRLAAGVIAGVIFGLLPIGL